MNSLRVRTLSLAVIAGVFAAAAACSDGTQDAGTQEVALVNVTPRGGSMTVDPNTRIQIEFDSGMANGMEQFCAVHLGGLDGEEVAGRWEWSQDRHVLTFTPDQPLRTSMQHTLHVGGGITNVEGHGMNFDQHGFDMGGEWADGDMFGPGGMMGGHPHMGEGWQHDNGTYGMAFPFWTAADSAPKVALVRVSPQGGSTNVDPNARIQLEFDHPMVDGVEALCAVHLGGLDGEEVPGAWQWSEDHHVLTFAPHDPLQLDSEHTLHVGGGITDVDGHGMDFDQHGFDMGGHWVDEEMFGSGGMMGGHSHMGEGWQHHNGTYGMAFPFSTTADTAPKAALLRVSPQGGSTNVDSNARIQLEFDHPMVDGVEALCAVHLGGLDGDEVPGAWQWSEDHHVLTFTPHDPLQLDSEHTLHVGGGIIDPDGHHMDFDQHGFDMGGHWVDEDMFGSGGMMGGHSHMGEGWQHHNGTYGMAFAFWTAP